MPISREIITIPYQKRDPDEHKKRIARAQVLMRELQLDALLVTSEHNFRYFVGDIATTPVQTTRPRFLLIPVDGEVIAAVPRGMDEFLSQTTWLENFRTWAGPSPRDEGVSCLTKLILETTNDGARIGTELGAESRLGMPVGDFLAVREAIAPRKFVDASNDLFTPMRMVKSASEIWNIETACKATSEAFIALPDLVSSDMTMRQICRVLEFEAFRRGADKTAKVASVRGRSGYATPYGAPTDVAVNHGDVLFIDAGFMFDYYWCDFNRNFAVGSVDASTSEAYKVVWDATQVGIETVRPGIRFKDLWQAMADAINSSGVGKISTVGRMGHSMGLWMPELPSVQHDDQTIVEPGMIINIEPSVSYQSDIDGSSKLMLHEEVVVVTEIGARLLTVRAPQEIPVIR